jgi:hypothetical protein
VADHLRPAVLAAYQRLFGLDLDHLAVEGCIIKRLAAARSPGPARWIVEKGPKRSLVTDTDGVLLGVVAAAANRRDDSLLAATLDTLDTLAVAEGLPRGLRVTCRQVWPSEA